ncbi:MAG: toll/interleukin-1 receptor domain-containing protein [Ginsengibacter sp.]
MNAEILNALRQVREAKSIVLDNLADITLSIQEREILRNILFNLDEQERTLINFTLQDNEDNINASSVALQNLIRGMDNVPQNLSSISNTIKKVSNILSALYDMNTSTKAKPPLPETRRTEKLIPPPAPAPPPAAFAPPAPVPVPTPSPEAQPSKGKILYDIPDGMIVNSQNKCIVRIGENEAIVKDDDTFGNAVKIEYVPISRVMNVELIDIAAPPHFSIKTIISTEQEVESGSYTEWLFWVTPLVEGNFSLLLKVSVIKIIDGKERKKDLVFEKPVNITSQPAIAPLPIIGAPSQNLLDEKNITEMEPPNVFISYAHKDKDYFDIFIENLGAQSGWNIWTDKNIEIGSDWYDRIQQGIKDADIGVLLVSAFFISSGFIKEHEYQKFNDLKQSKPGFIFLPVLLRDVDINRWQSLSQIQFFTADGDDYGFPDFNGKLLPFAALCIFNNKGTLNENYLRDTYFKNLVTKVNTEWLKTKRM